LGAVVSSANRDYLLSVSQVLKRERPFQQLLLYALALARRTGLRLHYFKCAWFDENDYFEFFPLHAVYQKKSAARDGIDIR
jgi:hypothetical protein